MRSSSRCWDDAALIASILTWRRLARPRGHVRTVQGVREGGDGRLKETDRLENSEL